MDINDINAALGGRKPRPTTAKKSGRKKSTGKTPAPVAVLWASEVAEIWMRLANEQGFEPPYNVNFLANEIETRTRRDPKIMRLAGENRGEDISRWVQKMAELFWKTDAEDGFTYVRAGDTASRIKDIFLVEV